MKPLSPVRRLIVGTLLLGLVGTAIELVLLEHYEEPWQLVPLFLIALAGIVLLWHLTRRHPASLWAVQGTMALLLVSSFAGIALHFRGAAEFQREVDPSLEGWALTKKVMRVKAPPLLAPGVMMQLGLMGLAYSHKHPDLLDTASNQLSVE